MLKGSLRLHDYYFLGLINDQKLATTTLHFELDERRATVMLAGVKKLALYDFITGNIVFSVTATKIGNIAEDDWVKSKPDIVTTFRGFVQDEYFPLDIDQFFKGVSDDDLFIYVTSSYGANLCAIAGTCTVEHIPAMDD